MRAWEREVATSAPLLPIENYISGGRRHKTVCSQTAHSGKDDGGSAGQIKSGTGHVADREFGLHLD